MSEKTKYLNNLISWQKAIYLKIRLIRDSSVMPLIKILSKFKCQPMHLTMIRFSMIVPIFFLVGVNDWLALIFLGLNVFLDCLDGALARYQKNESKKGQILDVAIDNLYVAFFVLALIHAKYLDGFWGSLYLISDLLNFILNMALVEKGKRSFPFFKNTYLFYVFYLIFVLMGWNYFDYLAVFFAIYMLIGDGFMFWEYLKLL